MTHGLFPERKGDLEEQWSRGGQYRSFFQRPLAT